MGFDEDSEPVVVFQDDQTGVQTSIDSVTSKYPSCGGHGTLEILEVIKIFESHNIPCCVVGISALKYYGAARVRHDWELCVPASLLTKAAAVLEVDPHNQTYEKAPNQEAQLHSLAHTFPRFRLTGYSLWFGIFPDEDCHFMCHPSNFERSLMGLPYPKLEVFAQSLVDTRSIVPLTDLIDGMDLTDEWGSMNLDLGGTNDVEWAKKKNEKIRASVPLAYTSCFLELSEASFDSMNIWQGVVRTKAQRIGTEMGKLAVTRFRFRNDDDPRSLKRDCA